MSDRWQERPEDLPCPHGAHRTTPDYSAKKRAECDRASGSGSMRTAARAELNPGVQLARSRCWTPSKTTGLPQQIVFGRRRTVLDSTQLEGYINQMQFVDLVWILVQLQKDFMRPVRASKHWWGIGWWWWEIYCCFRCNNGITMIFLKRSPFFKVCAEIFTEEITWGMGTCFKIIQWGRRLSGKVEGILMK